MMTFITNKLIQANVTFLVNILLCILLVQRIHFWSAKLNTIVIIAILIINLNYLFLLTKKIQNNFYPMIMSQILIKILLSYNLLIYIALSLVIIAELVIYIKKKKQNLYKSILSGILAVFILLVFVVNVLTSSVIEQKKHQVAANNDIRVSLYTIDTGVFGGNTDLIAEKRLFYVFSKTKNVLLNTDPSKLYSVEIDSNNRLLINNTLIDL